MHDETFDPFNEMTCSPKTGPTFGRQVIYTVTIDNVNSSSYLPK